jgi:hypothetical protein
MKWNVRVVYNVAVEAEDTTTAIDAALVRIAMGEVEVSRVFAESGPEQNADNDPGYPYLIDQENP